MYVYILDGYNFYTKAVAAIYYYNIYESIYDAVTTLTVSEEDGKKTNAGDIVHIPNKWVGVVKQVTTEQGVSTLNCNQIINILGRQQFYTGDFSAPIEDYVARQIREQYTDCPDEYYRRSYIRTYVGSATNKDIPPMPEAGQVYTLKSYINNLGRTASIKCTADAQASGLLFSLLKYQRGTKNVDMGNPSYILQENVFSRQAITKVTAYAQDLGLYSTWYLDGDGNITRNKPNISNRAAGEWAARTVAKGANVEQTVTDLIRANAYSHKITFDARPEEDFALYDQLNIKINGKVYQSYITGVITRSDSSLIRIECGELQTRYPYLELI